MKTIGCGDWGLSWGFGMTNKIGKLHKNEDGSYTWKGHSQGRHGRKWNLGSKVTFNVLNDKLLVGKVKGSFPIYDELLKGVVTLENTLIEDKIKADKKSNRDIKSKKKSIELANMNISQTELFKT